MNSREITTVGDLRKFLAEYESTWDEDYEAVMGKFENVKVMVPHYNELGKFKGYGPIDTGLMVDGNIVFIEPIKEF